MKSGSRLMHERQLRHSPDKLLEIDIFLPEIGFGVELPYWLNLGKIVSEPGSMREQMLHRDRIGCVHKCRFLRGAARADLHALELGNVFCDRVSKADLSAFDQLHYSCARDDFGHRINPANRVWSHRRL